MMSTPSIPDDKDWYCGINFTSIHPSIREPSPEGPLVNVVEGFHAAEFFIDSLYEKNRSNPFFSENDFDSLASFGGCFSFDPAAVNDWKRCYLLVKGKLSHDHIEPYSIDCDLISSTETLQILKLLAEWYLKHFGFEFPQFISLLNSMMNDPSKYAPYWDLWNQAIQREKKESMNRILVKNFSYLFKEVELTLFKKTPTLYKIYLNSTGKNDVHTFNPR